MMNNRIFTLLVIAILLLVAVFVIRQAAAILTFAGQQNSVLFYCK